MCVCDPNVRTPWCGKTAACMPPGKVATRIEPMPVHSETAPSAHDLVIADLQERKAMGLAKYNTTLQPHNGRDSLVDAYQEVLDLAAYIRNEIEKRRDQEKRIQELEAENRDLRGQLRAWVSG